MLGSFQVGLGSVWVYIGRLSFYLLITSVIYSNFNLFSHSQLSLQVDVFELEIVDVKSSAPCYEVMSPAYLKAVMPVDR